MKALRFAFLAAAAALTISGCGGGTGGTGSGGDTPTSAVSTGVMAKGSVIVNGVRFEDTAANISIDDTPKTAADLRDGMVVKVAGSVNADGINGTAQRVKALIEVRGTPTSVNAGANPQSFVVLGQTVFVDDQTVYSNLALGFGSISTSNLIEVHGLRDAGGNIRATRIEDTQAQMGDASLDEIRGFVSNAGVPNATSFNIGLQAVNASAAAIVPTGASYQNGTLVEVYCNVRPCTPGGIFQASVVKVEDSQDSAFQPSSGQRREVEGLISGFTGHPGDFSVAGIPVTTTNSTRFEGGISTDLGNNIKVEAEGSWNGTRLVANKIEFKRSVIRLQGATANRDTVAQTFDLQIANSTYVVKVALDSLTSGALPNDGLTCVQVRGERKTPASPLIVKAGEINLGCSNSDRHFIQAPVEGEVPVVMITLLGFDINVSDPTDTPEYKDVNDQPITRDVFFNTVTPATTGPAGPVPGTLVKVIFDTPGTTVRQVEIED